MNEQIEKLSKELNIPLDETNDDASSSVEDLQKTHQNLQSNLICICGTKQRNFNTGEERNCECNNVRCAPLNCKQHPPETHITNITSLECVTEVTEPSSSFATITSKSENISTVNIDNDEDQNNKQNKTESPVSIHIK